MPIKRKVVAGAVAALAVGGAGAGIAATEFVRSSPGAESKAIVDDAAKQLGIEPSKLSAALKKAFMDRVDAAVKAGRLTKAEGQELKQRIQSDEFPLFGPPALGHGFPGPRPFFHGLDAASDYLGLTEAQLRSRLNEGKTLAQIAKSEGKSVEGLKNALRTDAKDKLDAEVKAGHLTKAEEQRVLSDLDARIDDLVNAQLRLRFRDHHGFGFRDRGLHVFPRDRGFDRPPPFLPDAAA
jgi:hypothetical protein